MGPVMRYAKCRNPEGHDHRRNERGQAFVEYVLLVLVIAIVAVFAVRGLGKLAKTPFQEANTALEGSQNTATTAPPTLWQRLTKSR